MALLSLLILNLIGNGLIVILGIVLWSIKVVEVELLVEDVLMELEVELVEVVKVVADVEVELDVLEVEVERLVEVDVL